MSDPGTGDHGPADHRTGCCEADHGASVERTRLAWRRTAFSATAAGLLAARPAVAPDARPVDWLVAAAAMAAWTLLVALTYRRVRGLVVVPPLPGGRTVPACALVTAALAVLAGLVVMF